MSYYFDIPEGRLESTTYYSEPIPEWISQSFDANFFITKLLPALEEGKIAICCHSFGELEVDVLYWPGDCFIDNEVDEVQFISQFSTDIQRRIQVLKTRQREERKSYED